MGAAVFSPLQDQHIEKQHPKHGTLGVFTFAWPQPMTDLTGARATAKGEKPRQARHKLHWEIKWGGGTGRGRREGGERHLLWFSGFLC
jgi:hypothetical protein